MIIHLAFKVILLSFGSRYRLEFSPKNLCTLVIDVTLRIIESYATCMLKRDFEIEFSLFFPFIYETLDNSSFIYI